MIKHREECFDASFCGGFLRDALAPTAVTLLAGSVLVATVAGVQALWAEDLVLDGPTWLRLVLLSVPASLDLIVPAAASTGLVVALSRWAEEGSWVGVRSIGACGRSLLPAVLPVCLLTGIATARVALVDAPASRRVAREALEDRALRLAIWPGRTAGVGDLRIRAERVTREIDGSAWWEEVFFTSEDAIGFARRARVVRIGEGAGGGRAAGIELVDGALLGDDEMPWRLEWTRWVQEVPDPPLRVELAERTTPDLRAAAARTEASGRDASYEWCVWYKRWLHPLAALLFPLAALPLGATRRPGIGLAIAGVGYLAAVRMGDHLAPSIGAFAAACAGPLFTAALGIAAWAAWRDR